MCGCKRATVQFITWVCYTCITTFLLRLLERLRSIVMSVSVWLTICQTGYLRNHMRDIYYIFVHAAYFRGSVLLRHVYDRPDRRSPGKDFLPL